MARLTKHEEGLIVETFYGINPKTFQVESVSLTKGGVLQKFGPDAEFIQHPVLHDRSARSEIRVVWRLTDIVSVTTGIHDNEYEARVIAELRKKAQSQKAAADAQGSQRGSA